MDKSGGVQMDSSFRWLTVLPSYSCIVLGHSAAVDALHHEELAEHLLHGLGLQMGGQWQLSRGVCARLFARASTSLCCFEVTRPLPPGAAPSPISFYYSSFCLPASELLPFCCVIPRLFRHDSACDLVVAGIVADYVAAGAASTPSSATSFIDFTSASPSLSIPLDFGAGRITAAWGCRNFFDVSAVSDLPSPPPSPPRAGPLDHHSHAAATSTTTTTMVLLADLYAWSDIDSELSDMDGSLSSLDSRGVLHSEYTQLGAREVRPFDELDPWVPEAPFCARCGSPDVEAYERAADAYSRSRALRNCNV